MGVICAFPSQGLLEEADEEKKRLQGENEMLKALMKKEVDRLDSELAAKANVVDEYKRVVKQLSQKVDAAERRARHAEGGEILSLQHGLSLLDLGSRWWKSPSLSIEGGHQTLEPRLPRMYTTTS